MRQQQLLPDETPDDDTGLFGPITSTARRTTRSDYDAYRARQADISKRRSASGRDIGALPEVVDQERKDRCRLNLRTFCETYFRQTFYLGWSEDHLRVIAKIEESVLNGGLFAMAMPRGSGKTTLVERAALWSLLYGHRKFIVLIGATEDGSHEMCLTIQSEIETNELLMEDFPEVCFPVKMLDGINSRSNGQTCEGVHTKITWSSKEIVFPTVPGMASSGVVVVCSGITGRIRGMKRKIDGHDIRPDFVLVDDPQTDESANSPDQNGKRLKLLNGAILGLAGPGRKISGIMPCTVISPGDMADQILDSTKNPAWNGFRMKLLKEFPSRMDLWQKYYDERGESYRQYGDNRLGTKYYTDNREAMDAGGVVSWPERFNADQVSGLQYAMDLFFADKESFYSEYQNEPLKEEDAGSIQLTANAVMAKVGRLPRFAIDESITRITAFIDVQKNLLFYAVCGFTEDFSVSVIDYGAWPEQGKRHFRLSDAHPTYQDNFPGGFEGALHHALTTLTDHLLSRKYQREDGADLSIERCLIDSAWGDSTKTVYEFCKSSKFNAMLYPSKGRGISAAQRPMTEYRREPGMQLGYNWRIFRVHGYSTVRIFEYDTNFWKSFFRQRLLTPVGDKASLTLYNAPFEHHRLLTEHLTSEYSVETTGGGRRVDVWKLLPNRENHWLDCIVGSIVAASSIGVSMPDFGGHDKKRTPAKAQHTTAGRPAQTQHKTLGLGRVLSLNG